jgi:hypothetical protein
VAILLEDEEPWKKRKRKNRRELEREEKKLI